MGLIYALGNTDTCKKENHVHKTKYYDYSRYDTHDHSLSDYPSEDFEREVFPGQDYSNPRMKDFVNGK